jgi:phage terminase small subunit
MQTEIATPLDKLTDKQRKFVLEYVRHFNATRAALDAGYSKKTAYSIGSSNLKKVEVSEAIEWFFAENTMTAAEVLHHLTQIARGDFDHVADNYGGLDMITARENGATNLIKRTRSRSMTTSDKDGNGTDIHESEVELYDRLKALELLAKYHDLINRTRIDDWRSDAIRYIKNGELAFEPLVEQVGYDLATELFTLAGVPLLSSGIEGED